MTARVALPDATGTACTPGLFYMVPSLYVAPEVRSGYEDSAGFVPVLGPKHTDHEHLKFGWEHFHIDWRFVSARGYRLACLFSGVPHAKVITASVKRATLAADTVLKRRLCKRAMPDFPAVTDLKHCDDIGRWVALERAHACVRLKPGGICPHRGINLTPFARPDGTAVCPGHGLHWNLSTGELIPRHGKDLPARPAPTLEKTA